jgi:acyl carrier protein
MIHTLLLILKQEILGLSGANLNTPFDQLEVDSFTLVTLRARLEQCAGREVDDEIWISARTPADLVVMLSAGRTRQADGGGGRLIRSFNINMPQTTREID